MSGGFRLAVGILGYNVRKKMTADVASSLLLLERQPLE